MVLRDGLMWHDDKPVTAEDCIASIKRWGQKDAMGQKLMSFVETIAATDDKTIVIKLKAATGLVTLALGKPSSNVPFMMPKRVADTPPSEQIKEFVGSGPFVFVKEEWQPGSKIVYKKFDKYKPRSEPASGLAGGKVVKVDRVEWVPIRDHQQAVNALIAGEIDYIESPPHDLHPLMKSDSNITFTNWNPAGNQYTFRFNMLHKPFDNPKIRQALLYALNQEDFVKAVVGSDEYYKLCKALFVCGMPFETDAHMDGLLESNFKKARELLKEAGYDGTPVVLMHSTDLYVLTNLAPVAKSLMEKVGFKVDMQSMDWQTLVARRSKKDDPAKGGWNAFITSWTAGDLFNPVAHAFLNSSCEKALFGWPCDEQIEKLRDDFARAADPAKQKEIVKAIQARWVEYPTHAHLGQWYNMGFHNKKVSGIIAAGVPVLWNIEKK
ncbi:MAG: ABC transporter substrate-binding protein, partial [Alphaproteobacteria bacterium]|nr:ABC transporter substrate-binding protein [Alphaproteobacteria bacterium]